MYGDLRYVAKYWGGEVAAQVKELMAKSPKVGGVSIYEDLHFKFFKILWFQPANFTEPWVLYPEPRGKLEKIEAMDTWEALHYLAMHREAQRTEFIWRYSYPSTVSYVAEVALKSALRRTFGIKNVLLDDIISISKKDKFVIFTNEDWNAGMAIIATPQSWMIVDDIYRCSADIYGRLIPAASAARDFASRIELLKTDKDGVMKVASLLACPKLATYAARFFDEK